MRQLRELHITVNHKDFLDNQDVIGHALRWLKEELPSLSLAVLLVASSNAKASVVLERLTLWLHRARSAWPTKCHKFISSDVSKRGQNQTNCVGSLVTAEFLRRNKNPFTPSVSLTRSGLCRPRD